MKQIQPNFEEIKGWFDPDKWDIGYLTKEHLEICCQIPIKAQFIAKGWNFSNDIHFDWEKICNAIVLINHSSVSLDYLLYEKASEILSKHGLKEEIEWGHVYTNFKEAQILSGRGPLRFLLYMSKYSTAVKSPIFSGIGPESEQFGIL